MKLFITGASGFLGKSVIRAAAAAGHDVVALVRVESKYPAEEWSKLNVHVVTADIRTGDYEAALRGTDCVIHLAAALTGTLEQQAAVTLTGTLQLLSLMNAAGIGRLVCASSFAVYDYVALPTNSLLDEASPLEAHPEIRDFYCQNKLKQESCVRKSKSIRWTIVRPGAVIGHERLWTDRIGYRQSPTQWTVIGGDALIPRLFL
jgi:nucleoside-diphosphate-sugar epimerase